MRGASNRDGRTAALGCFPPRELAVAMTDRELARLFLGVALFRRHELEVGGGSVREPAFAENLMMDLAFRRHRVRR
jgi:hypothetical protein